MFTIYFQLEYGVLCFHLVHIILRQLFLFDWSKQAIHCACDFNHIVLLPKSQMLRYHTIFPYNICNSPFGSQIFFFIIIPGASVVKNLPTNAVGTEDMGSIPGSGISPGEGNGNPLQCSSGKSHGQRSLQSMESQKSQKLSDWACNVYIAHQSDSENPLSSR